jgi:hypothetical protein
MLNKNANFLLSPFAATLIFLIPFTTFFATVALRIKIKYAAVYCNDHCEEMCPICYDGEALNHGYVKLPCGHRCCNECTGTWAKACYESGKMPVCPMCRRPFIYFL